MRMESVVIYEYLSAMTDSRAALQVFSNNERPDNAAMK